MRLRQLAISQAVVFFAPPEVHQSILNLRGKTDRDAIDSYDVIIWLLEQTCCNIEQLQPLYISQGLEYCRRRLSALKNPDAGSEEEQRKAYLKVLEQPEQYSLEKLYAPDQRTKARPIDGHGFPAMIRYVEKLNLMKKGLHNTGDTVQALAHQEVEQEREVLIEVEQEREVKKPNHALALPQPPLQKEVKSFAETGRLVAGSQAYQQAFVALRHTALGRQLGVSDSATMSRLFVTQDFNSTVVTNSESLEMSIAVLFIGYFGVRLLTLLLYSAILKLMLSCLWYETKNQSARTSSRMQLQSQNRCSSLIHSNSTPCRLYQSHGKRRPGSFETWESLLVASTSTITTSIKQSVRHLTYPCPLLWQ